MGSLPNTEAFFGAGTPVRIERILCPIDFSEVAVPAYRYAQSMAGRYGAALVVQHVIEPWMHPCGFYAASVQLFEDFCRTLAANGRHDLQQFVNKYGGIQPECIVQGGFAADKILSLAQQQAISLLVLGTHGRRGFDRLMSGSVTERILRHASCPVLAVRKAGQNSDQPDAKDDSVRIRRILCCVDFSAHSKRAVGYALSLANAYHAELTVLHVLDHAARSADIGGDVAPGSPAIHRAVRRGKANREVLQFASEAQPDVIVAGVPGRHAWDRPVFGSSTFRVIESGPCPVLAVPT